MTPKKPIIYQLKHYFGALLSLIQLIIYHKTLILTKVFQYLSKTMRKYVSNLLYEN
jgi:hypothetical protein